MERQLKEAAGLPVLAEKALEKPDQPGACPFVQIGDLVVVKKGFASDRIKSVGIRDLRYTKNVRGCCKAFPKLRLIQGTDNRFYHPGTDLLGVDCDFCPYGRLIPEYEEPVEWI